MEADEALPEAAPVQDEAPALPELDSEAAPMEDVEAPPIVDEGEPETEEPSGE